MNKQQDKDKEFLKVKEYLVVIAELKGTDNAALQRAIIEQLYKHDGVYGIIYQKRTVDKLKVIPERELEKMRRSSP